MTSSLGYFQYHGECTLVFLDAPDFAFGQGLEIHIRTKIRYDYSFIQAAALKIGESILEVSSWGNYMVDGVQNAQLPRSLAGLYEVTHTHLSDKEHRFEVKLNTTETIVFTVFKDMVSIKLENPTTASFGNSRGLLGTFGHGLRVARNGTTFPSNDPNGFAGEWQVKDTDPMLFQVAIGPQYPEKCILPSPVKEKDRRRLGESVVSEDEARAACGHWSNKDACVYDVIATNDLSLAEATPY